MNASEAGHIAVVKLLLKAGADKDTQDEVSRILDRGVLIERYTRSQFFVVHFFNVSLCVNPISMSLFSL